MNHLKIVLIIAVWVLTACSPATPTVAPTPTPPLLAKEITYYGWPDELPQGVLDAFQAEFGVKVNYEGYESEEEGAANVRAGKVYDVVLIPNRMIKSLVDDNVLAEIDPSVVSNLKNIALNFRDLAYDPGNKHAIPAHWGTTGLVVRGDLVKPPITRWADLWRPDLQGKVAIWRGAPRDFIAATLVSLGYSANSKDPTELAAVLKKLLELRPHVIFIEDYDESTAAPLLVSGKAVVAFGYVNDMQIAQQEISAVTYILPAEGTILWGENFTIPTNSPNKYTAELFINFLLRPQVNADIYGPLGYATANEAAKAYLKPEILNNRFIYPTNEELHDAHIFQPLTPAEEKLYEDIWQRFLVDKS